MLGEICHKNTAGRGVALLRRLFYLFAAALFTMLVPGGASLAAGCVSHSEESAAKIDWETITPAELEELIVRGEFDANPILDGIGNECAPIIRAAFYSNEPDLLDVLVRYGATLNWEYSPAFKNPLNIAAYFGKLDMMDRLLQLGALETNPKIKGMNSVALAIMHSDNYNAESRKRGIKMLVENGVDVTVTDYIADDFSSNLMVSYIAELAKSKNKDRYIWENSGNNDSYEGMLPFLISLGMDVNSYVQYLDNGETRGAMHFAVVWNAGGNVIRELVEFGGDINLADSTGATPLMNVAISGRDIAVFDDLILLGANIDIRDNCGNSMLNYAYARINGKFDFLRTRWIEEGWHKTPDIDEWRAFGREIIKQIESLCETKEYRICTELEKQNFDINCYE